ncbi:hypothetical protein F5Y03DRAFT_396812 [Xylaria venustula]|nr:hypothetical protein F5Y03DRAFT_396812 [Xylaria venustula]
MGHDINKKTPRVSTSMGCQRSKYTLLIPLSTGAENVRASADDSSLIGYSALGIVCTLTIEGLIIPAPFINSAIRRYSNTPTRLSSHGGEQHGHPRSSPKT